MACHHDNCVSDPKAFFHTRRGVITGLASAAAAAAFWPLAAQARQPAGAAQRYALSLDAAQRAAIWRSLGHDAMKTQLSAGLSIGETVPDTMHLLPFARRLRKKNPGLRRHVYALVHGQVLVIEPKTKKIIAVVGE